MLVALVLTAQVARADITTDSSTTLVDSAIATPTTVAVGANSFTIRLWGTNGDTNRSGRIDVVNSYTMSTTGTITPGTTTTTITFPSTFKASACDGVGDPQGCASNPFTITATLTVAAGTPNDTSGTLRVSLLEVANSGVNADASPAVGYVRVGGANAAPTVGAITGATAQTEGSTGSYAVSATDPDRDSLTYAWTTTGNATISGAANAASALVAFGDGATTATVSVAVDDVHGHIVNRSTTVTISNAAPSGSLVAPTSVPEGSSIALAITSPSDPSAADTSAGFTYGFDCGSGYSGTTTTASASCATTDNGSRQVKAKIIDKDGGFSEYSTTVTIVNVAPSATFSASSPVNEGSDITLSLLGATDPSSVDTAAGFTYAFDCGSGSFGSYATSPSASCPTNDNGTRTARGKVRDKDGGETTYTVTSVQVVNVPPTAIFETSSTVTEGSDILLALTGADDPSGVDLASLAFAFDCGSGYAATGTVAATSCPTADQGARTVKGKVIDKDGGYTEYSHEVTITNVAPTATFTAPSSVDEGSPILQSLTNATDPSPADASAGFTYAFDCGSGYGPASTSSTIGCPTSDEGPRTVKGRVIDKDGGYTEYERSVSVLNVAPAIDAGAAASLEEGDTLTRPGSFVDPGADTWTASVSYGDGSTTESVSLIGSTFTLSHLYAQDGDYDVVVIVDDGTDSSSATFAVTVSNVAPDVIVPDGSATEGTTLTTSGSFADPGDDNWSATVDYGDGGGPTTLTLAADRSFALAHTYADNGAYTVTVAVSDDDTTTVTTATATVTNADPVVDAGTDTSVDEGSLMSRAGTFTDLGADVWSATVDYGDGTTGTVALAPDKTFDLAHTYADDGSYTLSVVVNDDDGGMGSTSFGVLVANVAPVVNAGADQSIQEGDLFTGMGSFTDPGADEWSATVDYGDGGASTTLTLANDKSFDLSHVYADNGTFTVSVAVSDGDALEPSATTLTVTVSNVGPMVDAGPGATIDEGDDFHGDGSFTDPGADDPWAASVDYGDTTSGTLDLVGKTFELEHRYTDEGTYLAVVTVTDKDGDSGSGTTTVTVSNVAPTVSAGADAEIDEGSEFTGSGSFTDPGADTWSATVDYGDGTTATLALTGNSFDLSHVYPRDGAYTVTVTVDDHDGGVTSGSLLVTVVNVAPTVLAGGDAALDEGASLTRSGSFTDPGADTWSATVDYGDGTTATLSLTGKTFVLDHQYVQDGSYTVEVAVNDGVTTTVAGFVVTVSNVVPEVTVVAGVADEGSTLTITGEFVDPGADVWSATVDYGDSSTGTVALGSDKSFSLSHVYADEGNYSVVVTVTDDDASGVGDAVAAVTNVDPVVAVIADTASFEGSLVETTGTFADPGADVWSATVDYGDGSGENPLVLDGMSFALSHTYADNSTYTVTIVVDDGDGGTGSSTFSAVVANVVPAVSVGAGGAVAEGSPFAGNGSFTDPGADVWSATVDYGDGGGPANLSLALDKSFALSHTYADNGVYTVTVAVADDDTDVGTSTATVTVSNVAPTVDAGPGASIDEGSTFESSGTVSDPGSVDTFTGTVDYEGFGSQALTIESDRTFSLSHTYADNGVFHPTVVATDDDGDSGSGATTVTVNNVAPTVLVGTGPAIDEGSTFTVSGSFTDPGADTWTGTALYGDESGIQPLPLSGTTFTLSHVYADDGDYTATATVTDDDGGVGEAVTTVTVRNVAPSVYAGADAALDEGGALSGSGSFTDPGADTWSARVDYGDGASWQPLALNGKSFGLLHTYAQDGSYTVTVEVSDGEATRTDTLAVTVSNVAPVVTIANGPEVNEGSQFTTTGSFTDPGVDTWTAWVDYGDSTTATLPLTGKTFSLAHTYVQDGSYTVTVHVTDDDATGNGTGSATIRNVAPSVTIASASLSSLTACAAGTPLRLQFQVSDPGVIDPTTGTISWGDGNSSSFSTRTVDMSHTFAAGSYTISVVAHDEDESGSAATSTVSSLYTTSGFLSPINSDGTSVFKKGSTIPVKIRVTDCRGAAVGSLAPEVQLKKIGASTGGEVEVVSSSAADTGQTMRWDGSVSQYIYNLSTKRSVFGGGADLTDGQYELKVVSSTFSPVVVRIALKP